MTLFDTFEKCIFERGLILTPILALNYKKCKPHLNDAFMACHVVTMHSDNIRHAELRILDTATNCAFFTVSRTIKQYNPENRASQFKEALDELAMSGLIMTMFTNGLIGTPLLGLHYQ